MLWLSLYVKPQRPPFGLTQLRVDTFCFNGNKPFFSCSLFLISQECPKECCLDRYDFILLYCLQVLCALRVHLIVYKHFKLLLLFACFVYRSFSACLYCPHLEEVGLTVHLVT